jgi:cbb3-type cytochrome oxidase maturation protein
MEILYLLIPLSAVLVLLIIGVFGWALHRGQFDDVEREGRRILQPDLVPFDGDQAPRQGRPEQSSRSETDHS